MSILTQLQTEAASLCVLYIEDEEAIAKQVSAFLKKFFASVDVCKNGAEGLENYRQKRQDIVVTDIAMPVMDGLTMSKAIKELTPNAEIIVTTAHAEQDLLLKAIDIGVEQYVLKPIEPSIFATALLKAIKVIKLEKRTKALNEKISNILNFQDNLIFLTDQDGILLCNQPFLKFFGFRSIRELKTAEFSFVSRLIADDGYVSAQNLTELATRLDGSNEQTKKVKMIDKATGKQRVFVIKINALPNEKEQIVSLVDITDFELHFKELEFKATHDSLTKVFNRMKFDSVLDAEISRSARYGDPLSLVRFDIDDLTKINDSFGAALGDAVIMKITQIISPLIRHDDMLARYGDDEFVVLALHTELGRAFDMALKLRDAIETASLSGVGTVTCSFGVVEYNSGEDADGFLGRASKLLKTAKLSGKNCVKTDEESEKKLRDDLKSKELSVLGAQFELVKAKDETMMLYLFYKGLPVSNPVKIDSFNARLGTLSITIPKRKTALFYRSKGCYLKHDLFAKTIFAEVKGLYLEKSLVVLHAFSQVANAPVSRKLLRLEPAKVTEVSLMYADSAQKGELIDISMNSVSVCVRSVTGLIIGLDAKALFCLGVDGTDIQIGLDMRVLKFFADVGCGGYKIVFATFPNQDSERALMNYFSSRQMELIREISALGID
jgi:diguanylate cyclase (GGDEF)-like protein